VRNCVFERNDILYDNLYIHFKFGDDHQLSGDSSAVEQLIAAQ
jgi:hypothetical protein